ncbi:hypothetical protein E2C06_15390 [Dankookia rubra]|uniref:Acyltransferase 3 domain-containing protein n=1 Tax=Dankookia rubra TaxID=1442381 RepID=A0A4V3AA48_9PROT|nr:acyltransferase family protein [Dankookia rubra]TDH61705.1 hypothetical protein E2C06_15390 [Dankookia rubra]
MGAEKGEQAGGGAAPRVRKERLAWPDLARGACMVLVVLLHIDHALRHIGQNDEYLHLLNELLVPLRQPLFFLISGVLGAGILSRGARGVLVHRVGRYLWLLVLWWALGRFLQLRLDAFGPPGMEPIFTSPPNLARLFATAQDDHWFFYALATFFGLAVVLSRLPGWLHAAVALLLAVPGLLDWGGPAASPPSTSSGTTRSSPWERGARLGFGRWRRGSAPGRRCWASGCSGPWRRVTRCGSTRCSARRSPRRWPCSRCRRGSAWRCGWRPGADRRRAG